MHLCRLVLLTCIDRGDRLDNQWCWHLTQWLTYFSRGSFVYRCNIILCIVIVELSFSNSFPCYCCVQVIVLYNYLWIPMSLSLILYGFSKLFLYCYIILLLLFMFIFQYWRIGGWNVSLWFDKGFWVRLYNLMLDPSDDHLLL